MKEEWKDIIGYEDRYQVSSLGKVRSLFAKYGKRKEPKILTVRVGRHGYSTACLYKNEKTKNILVHREMLKSFVGVENGLQASHLNGNRTDNRLENLKWCTIKENHSHKLIHGTHLRGEATSNSKLKETQVLNILNDSRSSSELANIYSVSRATIRRIKSREAWGWLKR